MKVLKRRISSSTEWDSFITAFLVECSWICFTVCVLSRCLTVGHMRNPIFLSPLNESTEKASTGGFHAANQRLCGEIAVRHSTSLYTPHSVHCVLTSVPSLQHNSTHHSNGPVTAIIHLINRVLISNVSQIHSNKYLFHCHVHMNDFANCAKGMFWGRIWDICFVPWCMEGCESSICTLLRLLL